MADACECGNEPSGSVKCGEFSQLLEKDSAPWSKLVSKIVFKKKIRIVHFFRPTQFSYLTCYQLMFQYFSVNLLVQIYIVSFKTFVSLIINLNKVTKKDQYIRQSHCTECQLVGSENSRHGALTVFKYNPQRNSWDI